MIEVVATDTSAPLQGGGLQSVGDYLPQLDDSNQTLVGTIVTFQPFLSGALLHPEYWDWMGAGGDYEILRIEDSNFLAFETKIIVLDASVESFTYNDLPNIGDGYHAPNLANFELQEMMIQMMIQMTIQMMMLVMILTYMY